MKNKRQFILAATLLALFSSPLLYAFEDCGTSVTECKLRQTIKALQEQNQKLVRQLEQMEKTAETAALPQESTSGFFQDRLKDGSLGPKMVWIPAGTFRMGDIQGGGGSSEKPVHRVSVSRFAMGMYEVTFAEYDKFAQATGRTKPSDSGWGRGNRPVIYVSWHDANAYAQWLTQQTGKKYRLPTEAEWEYAARAGTTTKYWWGNTASHEYANYGNTKEGKDRWEYTAPVGSFEPNPFGIYDTAGNVWEWTCSPNTNRYDGQEQRCVNSASHFVLRGGSWFYVAWRLRSANRLWWRPAGRYGGGGFRLARLP